MQDDGLWGLHGREQRIPRQHDRQLAKNQGRFRGLRDQGAGEGLIGYFGLGFLSAFAVSERVEVWTCSYQEPQVAHRFISRSGEMSEQGVVLAVRSSEHYEVAPAEGEPSVRGLYAYLAVPAEVRTADVLECVQSHTRQGGRGP